MARTGPHPRPSSIQSTPLTPALPIGLAQNHVTVEEFCRNTSSLWNQLLPEQLPAKHFERPSRSCRSVTRWRQVAFRCSLRASQQMAEMPRRSATVFPSLTGGLISKHLDLFRSCSSITDVIFWRRNRYRYEHRITCWRFLSTILDLGVSHMMVETS